MDVEVTRIPHTPAMARVASILDRRSRSARTNTSPTDAADQTAKGSIGSARLRDVVLNAWSAMQYPDGQASWSRDARRTALRVVAQRRIDLVMSTSPPVSAHQAAMRVAKQTRIPLVLDFRDLWTSNPAYNAPAWREALDRRLERQLLHAADGVIAVTDSFVSELAGRVRDGVPVICIPNGYDEDDFLGLQAIPRDPKAFRIVHAGTFYGKRSPQPFLEGVGRLLERHEAVRTRLRVRLIGALGTRFDGVLQEFSTRFPGVLERTGYVDHSRAVAEMLAADALLLVVGWGDAAAGVLPGKVFEYLRAARPILLVGSEQSESASLVRNYGSGEVVSGDRPEEVASILRSWIDGNAPTPDHSRIATFERRALTRRLAEFLADVHGRHVETVHRPS